MHELPNSEIESNELVDAMNWGYPIIVGIVFAVSYYLS